MSAMSEDPTRAFLLQHNNAPTFVSVQYVNGTVTSGKIVDGCFVSEDGRSFSLPFEGETMKITVFTPDRNHQVSVWADPKGIVAADLYRKQFAAGEQRQENASKIGELYAEAQKASNERSSASAQRSENAAKISENATRHESAEAERLILLQRIQQLEAAAATAASSSPSPIHGQQDLSLLVNSIQDLVRAFSLPGGHNASSTSDSTLALARHLAPIATSRGVDLCPFLASVQSHTGLAGSGVPLYRWATKARYASRLRAVLVEMGSFLLACDPNSAVFSFFEREKTKLGPQEWNIVRFGPPFLAAEIGAVYKAKERELYGVLCCARMADADPDCLEEYASGRMSIPSAPSFGGVRKEGGKKEGGGSGQKPSSKN